MLAPDLAPQDAPNTAGVIRKATDMDVVSFGRAGAGSAEAMTQRPAHIFAGRDCPMFPHLEDPGHFIIYFYEGNDLLDNIGLFWGIGGQVAHVDTAALDDFLATRYATVSTLDCYGHLFSTALRMARSLGGRGVLLPRFPPDRNAFVIAGTVSAPGLLQGPSLELSEQEMRAAAIVFDRSLMWLRQQFPRTQMTVVYIPAPLTVYRPASDTVSSVSYTGSARSFPSELVKQHSDFGCGLIRQFTLGRRVAFLDARETLNRAGKQEFVHGPRDWNHLNKAGYEALGTFIADYIRQGTEGSMACGT